MHRRPQPRQLTRLEHCEISHLFLISGAISSLMLLISIARLADARWTKPRDANEQSSDDTTPGSEESHPVQNATGNIFAQDQPHPEASRNEDYQGAAHGVTEYILTLNEESDDDDPHGAHRGSADYEERNSVRNNGYVPAQSFEMIEMNNV